MHMEYPFPKSNELRIRFVLEEYDGQGCNAEKLN